mgnify:CR=1 FL=1
MNKLTGLVTIPTDKTFVEGTKYFIKYWGADAVRDCDGVSLPKNVSEFGTDVYKAYFIVREDHEYAKKHPEYLQCSALSSKRITAFSNELKINLMEDFFDGEFEVLDKDYKKYWQVFDRTSGEEIKDFEYLGNNVVLIKNVIPFHQYSVNFFARIIWDPVQIYNYHVNNWTCEKDMDLDPIYPEALNHMLERLESWLIANPDITVIRFTTFFYNFFIACKTGTTQRLWDWHNYAMTASPRMFEEFKKATGIDIKLEDIINEGFYLGKNAIPTKNARKYIDFVQKTCCGWAKKFVDLCHKYGRKAMMFDGDHRIGVEPYNPYFKDIGLDAVVGAPSNGIYIQQIANIEGVKYTEGRFSPYFFPNECPGDEKGTDMLTKFWNSEKRGMLRKPLDRIGFGGYLKQISTYENFTKKVKEVCDEFRTIKANAGQEGCKTFLKVAIMSYWGKMDSWMFFGRFVDDFTANSLPLYSLLSALAGQPVDVDFISFDEVINGNLSKYDVVINSGVGGTSRQGDFYWGKPELVSKIREYVHNGGGFIGFKDPTGFQHQGKYFQLEDVLGVQKETDLTIHEKRFAYSTLDDHFILKNIDLNNVKFLNSNSQVYPTTAEVLNTRFDPDWDNTLPDGVANIGNVNLSVNNYGKGRSIYISGVYPSNDAHKLIYRALLWAANKEELENKCYSLNNNVDIYYYCNKKCYALLNNSSSAEKAIYFDIDGKKHEQTLMPNQILWVK